MESKAAKHSDDEWEAIFRQTATKLFAQAVDETEEGITATIGLSTALGMSIAHEVQRRKGKVGQPLDESALPTVLQCVSESIIHDIMVGLRQYGTNESLNS